VTAKPIQFEKSTAHSVGLSEAEVLRYMQLHQETTNLLRMHTDVNFAVRSYLFILFRTCARTEAVESVCNRNFL
jgi:hypothetical protein